MAVLTDPAGRAYLALCREMKAHPALRGSVTTWRFRDGQTSADDPPLLAQCPWVRLTPYGLASEPHDRSTIHQPLRVEIETAVARSDFPAAAKLWGIMNVAMFSTSHMASRRLQEAVRAAGASWIELERPAWPVSGDDYGPDLLTSKGAVILHIYVRTR